jgi:hypothetical protein
LDLRFSGGEHSASVNHYSFFLPAYIVLSSEYYK